MCIRDRTELAFRLTSYSEKLNRSAEGAVVPYFQLEDEEGNAIRSHDFSGKYLLLSFISSAGVESVSYTHLDVYKRQIRS